MNKIRISAVSYLNTKPFIYGLEKYQSELSEMELSLDNPAQCAEKLKAGSVEVGLVPVAILPALEQYEIISDYCIGAKGKVASVCLYSDVPLEEIKAIRLDYQSRTSVALVQILARELWKIEPEWLPTTEGYEQEIQGDTAGLVIGDRSFSMKEHEYVYDLAESWEQLTGKPFVFACWVATQRLPEDFIRRFNRALAEGIDRVEDILPQLQQGGVSEESLRDYLQNKIRYEFGTEQKEALALFLEYIGKA